MSDIVSPLLQWLNAHPQLAGLVTFIISAGESVAIIGTIVPGSIMMTALGTLAGAGVIPLWPTIFWAIMGAIVGDGISYWIGHYFKDRLPTVWPFRNYPGLLKTGEVFIHKYGGMSVFIGRFVGPVRALVPLVAGMLGMKPLTFTIANVTSAIGWAPAYMLPGILLGAASLELPPDIAVHVILVLMLITLFIMLCLWFAYKLFQLIQNHINQMQSSIWHYLKTSRQFAPITKVLKHYDSNQPHGQLNLAFYFLFTSVLFVCLAIYVKFTGPDNIMVNDALYHLFRGMRTSGADNIMLNITLLGQKQVILPVVLAIFAWFILWKRWRAAFHTLALGILAAGGAFVMKHIIQSPRPWGIFESPETYSMPSGHVTLATAIFMGLAFLAAVSRPNKCNWPIYFTAIIMVLAVCISRLYLGAHWFTDVVGALLLSASVLLLIIISYQRKVEKPVKAIGIILISLATLTVTLGYYHHRHFNQMQTSYAQMNWPSSQIPMNNFWQTNDAMPAYRTSLFGFPSQPINIEWVGNLEVIRQDLLKEGWNKPPARDWISTLHRVSDVKSTLYLPLVSPQYLDKKPALILTRPTTSGKNMLVLRLWDSNRTIAETQMTLWVGIVGIVPRSYSWLFKTNAGTLQVDPALIFPNKTAIGAWEWKIMTMNQTYMANETVQQKIMLIRANKSVHKKI